MADANKSGDGWKWFVVIAALIGGYLYLCQREGGNILAPEIRGFQAKWDTGVFSHDLLVTNNQPTRLDQVNVTLTFYPEEGEPSVEKRLWSVWEMGEIKKINVPARQYQKVEMKGFAMRNSGSVQINDAWPWVWGKTQ